MNDPANRVILNNIPNIDFSVALAIGAIPGMRADVKFGYALDFNGLHDVWGGADLQPIYQFMDIAGESITIESEEGADNQEIMVIGLDVAGALQVETVNLNGENLVAIPGTWIAVNRAFNNDGTPFTGRVLIKGTGPKSAIIYASLFVEDQGTVQCPYVVEAGQFAVINNYSTAINKSGGSDASSVMRLVVAEREKVGRTQIRYGLQRSGVSNLSSDLVVPILVPPLSQVKVTSETSAGADVSGEFSIVLVDETLVAEGLK